uniref:Uncharacterized protein n=1 Tax=Panagrolaimus davidi TaxID=227884 RepID=A0A914Q699_9BILA
MLWEFYEFTGRPNVRLNILASIIYHFSYNDNIKFDMHYYKIPKRKLMHKESEVHAHFNKNVTIEDLGFPHNLLEYYLYFYETLYPNKHLPHKIIKCNYDMRKLYEKIKAVEENEEKWIKLMEEADDIEFVKHNIEYKLGQDLTNKKLWILYIKYLKEYDVKPPDSPKFSLEMTLKV